MKIALLGFSILILCTTGIYANTGDTIHVTAHNDVSMTWYGNYDNVAVFPPPGSYHKIIMHYIMGCASGGCSGWDYTTIIDMMQHTGIYDSTLALPPNFTVNGSTIDTFVYNTGTVWFTGYDTATHLTDSVVATQVVVRQYSDTTHPYQLTDTLLVYPGDYWNYYYDTAGHKIDSVYVGGNETLVVYFTHVYTPYEVLQPHELGRVITPYGSYYNSVPGWSNDYVFDVTDYASLLHDTVLMRDFYSGWSSGFSVTLKFDFIQGTPARTVQHIYPMYNGYWGYGNINDPINNHLPSLTFPLSGNEKHVKLRFTPTGHGGGGTDNCSEFCSKYYDVNINSQLLAEDNIWRNDCGMNPLMHQSGTWIYDRAAWCPGAKGLRRDYEIPDGWFTPGDSINVDIAMQDYTSTPGGNPGYQIGAELFTYDNPSQEVDATIEDILQPSNGPEVTRFNPVCANPIVVLKSLGSQPLTSVDIHYGFLGENNYYYHWTGSLAYGQFDTVHLSNIVLNSTTPSHFFQVYTKLPNGQVDPYPYNDTARVYAKFPPVYDSVIIFQLRTNLDPTQNNWNLTDDAGNVLYSNDASSYLAGAIYRDTFHLHTGCYKFTLNDTGEDGLDFNFNWNGRGEGSARLTRINNTTLVTLQPDFGTQINQSFMVGKPLLPTSTTGFIENKMDLMFEVYPNPSTGKLSADISLPESQPISIQIFNALGQLTGNRNQEGFSSGIINFDLSNFSNGMYFIKLITKDQSITHRVMLQR